MRLPAASARGFRHSIAAIFIALALAGCDRKGDEPVVVISFNIRYDNPEDGIHQWEFRKDRVASLLAFYEADIAGLQEAQKNQIDDLVERLPDHDWYGVGRDDGLSAGEHVPIFYRRDRFDAVASGTFWLSPSPDVPGSMGWDAAITRIVSWVQLDDRQSGERLLVVNAHFDHIGEEARLESARMIRSFVAHRSDDKPVIVMGDFNAEPTSEPYNVLIADVPAKRRLYDALDRSAIRYGPETTFHGFAIGSAEPRRIDYVFVSDGVQVRRFGVLTDQIDGSYPSDHLPVLSEVALPAG